MQPRVVIEFPFQEVFDGYASASGTHDWGLMFIGGIHFKVGGKDFSSAERLFWFTSILMQSIDDFIYRGVTQCTIGFVYSLFYLGLRFDEESMTVGVFCHENPDALWDDPQDFAECELLELSRSVVRLHDAGVAAAQKLLQENKEISIDFRGLRGGESLTAF